MQNKQSFWSLSLQMMVVLVTVSLMACASTKKQAMDDPTKTIVVGKTTCEEIQQTFGTADEKIVTEEGTDVWVYEDVMKVPLLVSFIPVVGDVADLAELKHKNRELIVQFDSLGLVKKVKVRNVD